MFTFSLLSKYKIGQSNQQRVERAVQNMPLFWSYRIEIDNFRGRIYY